MELKKYFETISGHGIIATANAQGETTAAVYARPHVIDEETIAFIMREGRTHSNLSSNPNATYLFMEQGEGHNGKRLYLTKIDEEQDQEKIDGLRLERGSEIYERYKGASANLVYFRVDQVRPLVGDD